MSTDLAIDEMSRSELEERVKELEANNTELEARQEGMSTRFEALLSILFGSSDEFATIDPESFNDILSRLQTMETELEEVKNGQEMLVSDIGNGRDDPDGRARLIRQTLLNKAGSDGKASLTRDEASARLGGDLHRDSVLGAMKRAADGKRAEEPNQNYTPINGSSDLQPVDSVTFRVSKGKDRQSLVSLDLDDATQKEVRHNLTTEQPRKGGPE